uniref:Putative long-distance movement protein n=1 Tax=Red clover umbravirus TaxID=2301725 RepID=A0A3Q8GZB9_9TOMB|nr:putative long-distance movement protein [Red clover umbravirus]
MADGNHMAIIINVNNNERSKQAGAPGSTVWGSHNERARGVKPRRNDSRTRKREGHNHPTPTPKNTGKGKLGTEAVPKHPKHGGATIRGEGSRSVHTTRSRQRARRSGDMAPRQHPSRSRECRQEAQAKIERRATAVSVLPVLLDSIRGLDLNPTEVLFHCYRASRGKFRRGLQPVQSVPDVEPADRSSGPQLPPERATCTGNMPHEGERCPDGSIEPAGVSEGCDVKQVCHACN